LTKSIAVCYYVYVFNFQEMHDLGLIEVNGYFKQQLSLVLTALLDVCLVKSKVEKRKVKVPMNV